ncbi:MAG: AMP-binding protein [Solirubrobacteraceae bacterium]
MVEALTAQAEARPSDVVLRFVEPAKRHKTGEKADTGAAASMMTFADLHQRANLVAARLARSITRGDRVLVLCEPGLDYVAALFGCFYAGAIAVPAYPPISAGGEERLAHLIGDCTPSAVLTTTLLIPAISELTERYELPLLGADELVAPDATPEQIRYRADDIVLLQYTSGSTADPRGVMLSNTNVLKNVAAIIDLAAGSTKDRGVFWLPPYHDMGLIGGIFTSLICGTETTLMSPVAFLADPLSWLEVFSEQAGTFSAAPNFAYDLCVRRARQSPDRVAGLDLSAWRIAINGAEPVRYETMVRFADCFRAHGFKMTAFMPCYGMAEATLLMTGVRAGSGPHVSAATKGAAVSVGSTVAGGQVTIATETGKPCADGDVGEICYRGPSVARGYWGRDAETAATFGVSLNHESSEPYLRTGDLGLMRDNQLYVTGRAKDVIILRGQNYYPHDIEQAAAEADERVRPGCAAAFQIEHSGDPRVVLAAELVRDDLAQATMSEIAGRVRQHIAKEHRISLDEVILIRRGASLKTSSGKIRRGATRDAYEGGSLATLASLSRPADESGNEAPSNSRTLASDAEAIARGMREALGTKAFGSDDDFFARGGDSLAAAEVVAILEEHDFDAAVEDVYRFSTPRRLADELRRRRGAGGPRARAGLARVLRAAIPTAPDAETYALSPIQRRWAADYLGDRTKTWGNLSLRLPLADDGRATILGQALATLFQRHEALRTTFPRDASGGLHQKVNETMDVPVVSHDLRDLTEAERAARIAQVAAAEAKTVFDLDTGPAARAALLRCSSSSAEVIVTLHHMLADGWSLLALREELATAYQDLSHGATPETRTPAMRYRDYSEWLNDLEACGALEASRDYWLAELDGDLPTTMPVDDALAADGADWGGASVVEVLPSELAAGVKRVAADRRVSVSAVLFGTFFAALRDFTGARDLIVGTPLAGRDRQDLKSLVGMFINLVPIRVRFRQGWKATRRDRRRARQAAGRGQSPAISA